MPCIEYIPRKFGAKVSAVIDRVNMVLQEYAEAGIDLTLRQVYYQFVARGWVKNNLQEYKKLGETIDHGRLAGLIDWDRIQDRTRFLRTISSWTDPASIIRGAYRSYQEDLWADQPCRIEIWIEKDAQIGNVESVSDSERVPFLSCRGYTSQSEMWRAAQRLQAHCDGDQVVHILHLGDHDPSGLDMSRDIQERLDLFTYPGCVTLHRLALNHDQVLKYNPPPNPAKMTDCRAEKYCAQFGKDSWELDALNPKVIQDLLRKTIASFRDAKKWKASLAKEARNKDTLGEISNNYADVVEFLKSKKK